METSSRRQKRQALKSARREAKIVNISERFGLALSDTVSTSLCGVDATSWLHFVLNLFFKSPALTTCFFDALNPHPALAMQSLISALLCDDAGNYAPEDYHIVRWLNRMSISFFLLHRPDNMLETSRTTLMFAPILDHFLTLVGDLQRQAISMEDEAVHLTTQAKALDVSSRNQVVTAAQAAYDAQTARVKQIRQRIRDNQQGSVRETDSQAEARYLRLAVAESELDPGVEEQKRLRKELDKIRRANKLDKELQTRIADMKKRAKTLKLEGSELRNKAQCHIDGLYRLYSQVRNPSSPPTAGDDNEIQPITWPVNVKTATGHDLWPLLAHNEIKRKISMMLYHCLLNSRYEYASRDFQGLVADRHRGQNYHPWRAAWHDFDRYPLVFLKYVVDPTTLKSHAIDGVHPSDLAKMQPSVWAWKMVVLSSVTSQFYQINYDPDVRRICYGHHGARKSSYAFNCVNTCGIDSTKSSGQAPPFSLPTRRAITLEQHFDEYCYWFDTRFRSISYISDMLLIGSPPLQETRPSDQRLPRFQNIWNMMANAAQSSPHSTSSTAFRRRAKRRRIAGSVCFIFTPPPKVAQLIRVIHPDEDEDERKVDAFVAPGIILSWVEREGRKCVAVYTLPMDIRNGFKKHMIMVIDENGLAYPTIHLNYCTYAPPRTCSFWKYGKGDFLKLLELLERGPKMAIELLGKLSGACCCCGQRLKAQKSLERGVGPVCAKRFTLSQFANYIERYDVTSDDVPVIHLAKIPVIVSTATEDDDAEVDDDDSELSDDDEVSSCSALMMDDNDDDDIHADNLDDLEEQND